MEGFVVNYFEDMNCLEPKCPNCGTTLDYGANTKFDEKVEAHVCLSCGQVLK